MIVVVIFFSAKSEPSAAMIDCIRANELKKNTDKVLQGYLKNWVCIIIALMFTRLKTYKHAYVRMYINSSDIFLIRYVLLIVGL